MVRREAEYTLSICPALTLRTDEADRCDAGISLQQVALQAQEKTECGDHPLGRVEPRNRNSIQVSACTACSFAKYVWENHEESHKTAEGCRLHVHGQSKCACDDVSSFGCLEAPTSCPSFVSKVLTSHCSGCAVTSPRAFSHDFVAVQFFAVDAGAVQERGSGDKTASDGVTGRSVEQPRRNGFVSNEQLSCTSSTTCHILFRSRHRSQDWFLTAAVWRVCCMWRGAVCVGCRGCCADTEVRM